MRSARLVGAMTVAFKATVTLAGQLIFLASLTPVDAYTPGKKFLRSDTVVPFDCAQRVLLMQI
jgi:hypothetical protein